MIPTSLHKAFGAALWVRVAIVAIAGALPMMIGTSAQAESAVDWTLQPVAAFVEAYVYACQPVEYDNAGVREPLNEAASRVHDELLVGQYDGSCRSFYFEEVVPRLDGELQPFFIPAQSLEKAYRGTRPAP